MTITMGAAHSAYGKTEAGDQKQTTSPDYSGEVSLSEYTNETAFINTFRGWTILRPNSVEDASRCASAMVVACNNPNIGYLYGGKGMVCQGGSNTTTTSVKCVTDCSGLVSQCATEGTGTKMYAATSGMAAAFTNSGRFSNMGTFQSYTSTPIYNGDVLVKPGNHTEMVVGGNPRSGTEDEVLSRTVSNSTGVVTSEITALREGTDIQRAFSPRRYPPDPTQEGYSFYEQSFGVTKNGSYAWGRFSEICQSDCTLSRGEPRRWFVNSEDGYMRGVSPAVGAVMCFTNAYNTSDPGYVCIVENIDQQIVEDTQISVIYISHYSLGNGSRFQYLKRTKTNGSWDLDLDGDGIFEHIFQGFIYNPNVNSYYAAGSDSSAGTLSYLQTFIAVAREQIGQGPSFTAKNGGMDTSNQSWSGGFIRACAARAGGILGVIIPDTISCSAIGSTGVALDMGIWLDGPCLGGRPTVQIGDIALFRTSDLKYRLNYGADKAGIVVSVSSTGADIIKGQVSYSFQVVMGDCSGRVAIKQYTNLSNSLSGIFRPNWDYVDTIAVSPQTVTSLYGMYTQAASIEDAAIRDYKYITGSGSSIKPSIKSTGMKLCVINYTGMLANLYGAFAEMSEYLQRRQDQGDYIPFIAGGTGQLTSSNLAGGGAVGDMSAVPAAQQIYQLLNAKINNPAGTIGIMANMWQESRWSCSALNSSDGGSGLIQWTDTSSKWGESKRCTNMRNYCSTHGGDWKTNLTGQIAFLFEECTPGSSYYSSDYKKGMDAIKNVSNSAEGAKEACKLFLEWFEIGRGNVGSARESRELNTRYPFAESAWALFMGGAGTTAPSSSVPAASGSGGQTIMEPSGKSGQDVAQYALQFVGNPYVWGGTSLTNGCDCSGFVMSVYKAFGISLPHSSLSLRNVGAAINGSPQAGDIICYNGHVAISIGGSRIVHAANSKDGIKTSDNYKYNTVLAIRRVL